MVLWEFVRSAFGKGVAEFIALVILAIGGIALGAAWKSVKGLIAYHRKLDRVRYAVGRQTTATGKREGKGIWLAEPTSVALNSDFRSRHDASRVLVVANAKGGVGKTTTVANIGACLCKILPKPVLLIDLDFQGTLSSMAVAKQWLPPPGSDSRATHLISGDLKPTEVANTAQHAAHEERLKIITAFYDLAQAENRIMIEWLIGDLNKDIRFQLADVLHDQAVRDAFSLIIIDCAPRITTATVQALAAGTHLLIPTVMDDPSAEAVITFIQEVERFKKAQICPHIKYLGVAGSLQPPVGNIDGTIKRLSDRLSEIGSKGSATELSPNVGDGLRAQAAALG